jgi:hypothetical protein
MKAAFLSLLAYELAHAGWAFTDETEYEGGARVRVRRGRAWRVAPCR